MKKISVAIFIAIIILAAFLRFFRLADYPVGFHIDEAAIGYNAWTISQDGKDEWGTSWPVLFKSFGDYKAPGMIYTTALSQKIFGHNEWAVRFPSALAGIGAVIVVFFLVKELFYFENFKLKIALAASLLLAISSWHLQFSRLAFEGSLALFFTLFATLLFLLAFKKNIWLIPASLFFFSLAVMTYHAEKIFVPLFLAVLILVFRKSLLNKKAFLALLIGSLFFLPYLPTYFSAEGRARAVSESIFGQKESPAKLFQENYVASFSLDYLFFRGDQNGRHSVKKLGELYVWQLPLVLVGIYFLVRRRTPATVIILAWLMLAALPTALVRPAPHAYRNLLAVPMWQVITAIGLSAISIKMSRLKYVFVGITAIFILHSLTVYLDWYYTHVPRMFGPDFNDGYREAALYLKAQEDKYGKFAVQDSLPPIYLRFYQNDFARYQYFKDPFEFPAGTLGLMPVWMVSEDNPKIVKTIKLKNGDPLFYAYKY